MVEALRGTRPWVLFVSILALIATAFMVLCACGAIGIGIVAQGFAGELGGPGGILLLLIYFVLYAMAALVYAVMAYYLYKYAAAIRSFVSSHGTPHMEAALGYQRSFWRVIGIVTIIYIVLACVGGVVAIIVALAVGLGR
jgi:hypothetical protein